MGAMNVCHSVSKKKGHSCPSGVRKVTAPSLTRGNKRRAVVGLTKTALARATVPDCVKTAVLTILSEGPKSTAARNLVVTQHQMKALRSNPNANTALTRKQFKRLRTRAKASGLLDVAASDSMMTE